MYRTKDDVLTALRTGNTTIANVQQRISAYRKKKNLPLVVMFFSALEEYRMFHKGVSDD